MTDAKHADKTRHQRARRAAERQGFKLVAVKTEAGGIPRDPRAPLHGVWELWQGDTVVVKGKIDAIEHYLFERPI